MAGLTLDPAKCVRALAKFSECTHCVEICPVEIISVDNHLPAFNMSACVGCGGCVSSCPTEAFTLDDFNQTNFFFEFAQSQETLISCKKNVPCLAALSVDHLTSLALLKEDVVCDTGHCDGCEIAQKLKPQIDANIEEANFILEAIESPKSIKSEDVSYEPEDLAEDDDRRGFFRKMTIQNAAKAKHDFERRVEVESDEELRHEVFTEDISRLKEKKVPDKRKIFFTALKRAPKPSQYHVIDAHELSFTSMKNLDEETCTACQMCYRICPTAALSSDVKNSKIDFDPFLCVKCHLCHDVCEPDSISLGDTFDLKQFFEPEVKRLVTFTIRRCHECDTHFTYRGGEVICPRCKLEEEEAKELWGIE
ncbi:4Fe-4S binding protein [Campylobacterota bacterium]